MRGMKSKRQLSRPLLQSPFKLTWPDVLTESEAEILLTKVVDFCKLQNVKRPVSKGRKHKNPQQPNGTSASLENPAKEISVCRPKSNVVVIGLQQILRAMGTSPCELSFVLVDKRCLVAKIPAFHVGLCAARCSVPVGVVKDLSAKLANHLNLKSVNAIGFRNVVLVAESFSTLRAALLKRVQVSVTLPSIAGNNEWPRQAIKLTAEEDAVLTPDGATVSTATEDKSSNDELILSCAHYVSATTVQMPISLNSNKKRKRKKWKK